MSVIKPRNKLVYCRISEDEFQRFSLMCGPTGARSLSDLMRTALERMGQNHDLAAEASLSQKLESLDLLIEELRLKLSHLEELVEVVSRQASRLEPPKRDTVV